jgi:hypothetical protein
MALGVLATACPRSVSARISAAPDGRVVLHQQQLCHDRTVSVIAWHAPAYAIMRPIWLDSLEALFTWP